MYPHESTCTYVGRMDLEVPRSIEEQFAVYISVKDYIKIFQKLHKILKELCSLHNWHARNRSLDPEKHNGNESSTLASPQIFNIPNHTKKMNSSKSSRYHKTSFHFISSFSRLKFNVHLVRLHCHLLTLLLQGIPSLSSKHYTRLPSAQQVLNSW